MQEKDQQAPPYYSNVISGEVNVRTAIQNGFRPVGVIHEFGMKWECGHEGDAQEISHDRLGAVKACRQCLEEVLR